MMVQILGRIIIFPAQSKTDPLVIGITPNWRDLTDVHYKRGYYIKSSDGGNWSNMEGNFTKKC